jgi:hypothetical protein
MSYWDTSTLVKLYAKEPDSAAFEAQALSAPVGTVTSRIAIYEARAVSISGGIEVLRLRRDLEPVELLTWQTGVRVAGGFSAGRQIGSDEVSNRADR